MHIRQCTWPVIRDSDIHCSYRITFGGWRVGSVVHVEISHGQVCLIALSGGLYRRYAHRYTGAGLPGRPCTVRNPLEIATISVYHIDTHIATHSSESNTGSIRGPTWIISILYQQDLVATVRLHDVDSWSGRVGNLAPVWRPVWVSFVASSKPNRIAPVCISDIDSSGHPLIRYLRPIG